MAEITFQKMNLHVGRALKILADIYPTIASTILELVQNSLDSDATDIQIIIDYKNHMLCVRDNGFGMSPEKFQQAISSIGSSLKEENNKLGQFGIGLLSPLGKCEGFSITSAAKSAKHEYNRWVFDSDKILKNGNLSEIPMIPMPHFSYSKTGSGSRSKKNELVSWRTEAALSHFSRDRSINSVSLEEIRSLILGKFSEAMKKNDTEISILIKPASKAKKERTVFKAASFSGERLGEVIYGDQKLGQTSFDIYLSPKTKTGRKGRLLVGIEGNDFRIPMDIFLKSATTEIDRDIAEVLLSGTFEGSIVSSNCLLHQNRKEFADNEARLNFLIHLESWVKHHGRKHIASIKDSEKDTWLQAVGSLAISQLEERIKKEMPHLLNIIKGFKTGTIGQGHYGFDEAKQEQKFSSSKQSFTDRKKKNGKKVDNVDREPTLHPGHTPFKVAGKGSKRKTVRGHSTGLQFVYEEMPGNDNHWQFDEKTGVLIFNMRSDIWAKMEKTERNLILYQQYVAIKALEMQLSPPSIRGHIFEFLQKELKSAAFFITTTSHLQPRRLRSEVGKKVKSL